jgi:hypothetical protein
LTIRVIKIKSESRLALEAELAAINYTPVIRKCIDNLLGWSFSWIIERCARQKLVHLADFVVLLFGKQF